MTFRKKKLPINSTRKNKVERAERRENKIREDTGKYSENKEYFCQVFVSA